jgi:type II secretory ATPase GspE/PulE/Tfp pilus assembly ATPase PilB-like protein
MAYLISPDSWRVALKAYERAPIFRKIKTGVTISEEDLNQASEKIVSLKDLTVNIEEAPTTEAVTMIIAGGLKTRASDIHLEAEEKGVTLRYRIDGVLYNVATVPAVTAVKTIPRLKLLSGLKINVADRPQDGRFTIFLTGESVDVRVSSLPTAYGESIVMRLLRGSAAGIEFEGLGLVGRAQEDLAAEMKKPNGMILSTGPTGSGKTTTLYAIINKLNNAERKIITIEDPIEYKLVGVNQSQVEASRGYTFANGLRSILRQDPNIIMVGEIRDPETADIAVQAALTGHLVLSTLHTNNAAGAIPRLLSLGAIASLLPSALNAVLGQRLVRRLCDSCKVPNVPDKTMQKQVEEALNKLPTSEQNRIPEKRQFLKGKGCDVCQGLGYKGQVGIFEVLVMSTDLKKAITINRASDTEVEELAEANGMVTMFQDGVLKALAGITAIEEVFRVTKE